MRDLAYLRLLSRSYPTIPSVQAELIRLRSLSALPKETEYFFSDLHGEHDAFIYLMRSSSGLVRAKIDETFGRLLTEDEQLALANLINFPHHYLRSAEHPETETDAWQWTTLNKLIMVARCVIHKYTREMVQRKLPEDYAEAIDELLHANEDDPDKKAYYHEMLKSIMDTGAAPDFITALSELIRSLTIDRLHIIGDIFDRGPRPDKIMDELIDFDNVDIQWGNHDAEWIGAAFGNPACIASALRIATSYNSFDVLEDGYGINLRPLSMYAEKVYGQDPCTCFQPHLLDQNVSDSVQPQLAARMCKAISVILFKEEGQLIRRHPEYQMENRLLLDKINDADGTIMLDGKVYPLLDTHFPSIDPCDPYKLTDEEQELMDTLVYSFTHSALLQKHIRFLFTHGSMYLIYNHNLLFHGCVPMEEDGTFQKVEFAEGTYQGRQLLDYFHEKVNEIFYMNAEDRPEAADLLYYLWVGPKSPLFGKSKAATFENALIADPAARVETYNAYYQLSREEKYVDKILEDFGLDPKGAHIINGHVPVKVKKGESPVKANGKLFVIDGGLSKAYHPKTGIAGYTLIYNSRHLALAQHKNYVPGEENTPDMLVVEEMKKRVLISDTDLGKVLQQEIDDLTELLQAYRNGEIVYQANPLNVQPS